MTEEKAKAVKRILPLSCIALVMLVIVFFISFFLTQQPEELEEAEPVIVEYAEGYDELELYVERYHEIERIKVWQAEDGVYYFFLPSYVDDRTVLTIGNLKSGDTLLLGGQNCTSEDNLQELVKWGTTCEIQLTLDGKELNKVKAVFYKSENLASIHIDTETGSLENIHEDKEVKEEAYLTVRDKKGKITYQDNLEYIKTRGNSTFLWSDKKPYQIKLNKKASLLGMDKAKKWILLANYVDDSLIKNRFVYHFAEEYTDIPSIRGEYVDLYMNNEYVGNYYLCEKVEVGENRLNITDLEALTEAANLPKEATKPSDESQELPQTDEKEEVDIKLEELGEPYVSEDDKIHAVKGLNNPEDITGGYLVELIPSTEYPEAVNAFRTDRGRTYSIISPENATVEQAEYICGIFDELEAAIFEKDGIHPETGRHFTEYIDLESWATKYMLEEAFHNPDGPYASAYFYKEADSIDSKVYAGPMWDYDKALGNYGVSIYYMDEPMGLGYYSVYARELMEHSEFSDMVVTQFETLLCPYTEEQAKKDIEKWQKDIEASAQMDKIRWPGSRGYYETTNANTDYVALYVKERVDYLKDEWIEGEGYHTVTFLDYYGNVYEKYTVKHGETLPDIPIIKAYVAIFNGWASTATGKKPDIRRPVLEDAEYQSQWIELDILLENGLNMSGIDLQEIDLEAIIALTEEIKRQQEADEQLEVNEQ